jgi:hypothetical protein
MKAPKRRHRKSPPVAFSAYVSKHPDRSTGVWMARQELMESVRRVFPKFLEALETDVLPYFRKLADARYEFELIINGRGSPYRTLTNDGGLKRALSIWAKQFRADSDWVLDDALRTLSYWYAYPCWRESWRWASVHKGSPSGAMGEPFLFSCAGWELEAVTWAGYREFVHKTVDQELLKYKRNMPSLADSHELVLAQHKYEVANLDWFVLYQFAGLSISDIAERVFQERPEGVDLSGIRKGIKAAERLVSWDRMRNGKIQSPYKSS